MTTQPDIQDLGSSHIIFNYQYGFTGFHEASVKNGYRCGESNQVNPRKIFKVNQRGQGAADKKQLRQDQRCRGQIYKRKLIIDLSFHKKP